MSQVYRLTAEKPERLNPQVLVALMNILDRTADNVIVKVRVLTAATTGTDGGEGAMRRSPCPGTRGTGPRGRASPRLLPSTGR